MIVSVGIIISITCGLSKRSALPKNILGSTFKLCNPKYPYSIAHADINYMTMLLK